MGLDDDRDDVRDYVYIRRDESLNRIRDEGVVRSRRIELVATSTQV